MRENRIGEVHTTNEGHKIKIIRYLNSMNCTIQFKSGFIIENKQYDSVKKGQIRNPFHPSVFNIGYFGDGEFTSTYSSIKRMYNAWTGILRRSYDNKYHLSKPTYKGCSVDKRWHNFQVFAAWFEENYVEGFDLDKDILVKGNKTYSPETCCFVPKEINKLFTKSHKTRGKYPIGVHYNINSKRFIANFRVDNILKQIGLFNTPEEAFEAYKKAKENYIKEVANKYRNTITEACYKALINYKVEITD